MNREYLNKKISLKLTAKQGRILLKIFCYAFRENNCICVPPSELEKMFANLARKLGMKHKTTEGTEI